MKFFKTKTINTLIDGLKMEDQIDKYWQKKPLSFSSDELALDPDTVRSLNDSELIQSCKEERSDIENAIKIYEALSGLSYSQASDPRLWTYLTHVPFWSYVQCRYPREKAGKTLDDHALYIQRHWFINPINWYGIIRTNAISRLWWMVALTVCDNEEDKYRLTKELFSMQDYTSHLLTYPLGRSRNVRHAVLEFVIENEQLFSSHKEAKVRFIMRTLNLEAGRLVIGILSVEDIKKIILTKKEIIEKVIAK